MSLLDAATLGLAVLVAGYLLVALLLPERF